MCIRDSRHSPRTQACISARAGRSCAARACRARSCRTQSTARDRRLATSYAAFAWLSHVEGNRAPRLERVRGGPFLQLDQLEILLARAALGTAPVGRYVVPARSGRYAVFRHAHGLVVDVTVDQAHVLL